MLNRTACWRSFPVLALSLAASVWGQTSPLYVTEYSGNRGAIIQDGAVIDTFNTTIPGENGVAVYDTMRIIATNGGQGGSEYDLEGNVLRNNQYFNTGYSSLYDGTT